MKVILGIEKIRSLNNAVVALGVFDGLHRGHKRILSAAIKKAREINGTSVVLTFWPHPQAEEGLSSLEHRIRLIADLGVNICVVINFNKRFSGLSAEDFVKKILLKKLKVKYIYIGKNYRFGKSARGDYRTLTRFSNIYGFKVKPISIIKYGGFPISSTRIRKLIKSGKLEAAKLLLGRRVSVLGSVIRGDSLGKKLGFPTANIDQHHEVVPLAGIYAVKIILKNKEYKGVCYIGTRPTLNAKTNKVNIEAYIFNFHKNIYGRFIEIQFIKRIRSDQKFDTLSDLTEQIKKDVIAVKKIFSPRLPATTDWRLSTNNH